MKVMKYTAFRNSARTVLDECHDTGEPVLILSKNDQQMVVIPKAKYDKLTEKNND